MPAYSTRTQLVSRRVSGVLGLLVVAIGVVVLIGWVAGFERWTRIGDGYATMKVNSALSFAALGAAIYWLRDSASSARARTASLALSAFAIAICGVTLVEAAMHWNLGIDELLVRDPYTDRTLASPGRTSSAVAIGVVLLGLGGVLSIKPARRRAGEWCALLALGIASTALLGYLFGVQSLYAVALFGTMAVHSAVAILLAAIALLCAHPERGVIGVVFSDTASGAAARHVLPFALLIPITLGGLTLYAHRAGWLTEEFGVAAFAAACALGFGAWVLASARKGYVAEVERRKDDDARLELESRFQQIVRAVDDVFWLVDWKAQHLVYVSPSYEAIWGRSLSKLYAENLDWLGAIVPEQRERVKRAFEEDLPRGRYDIEFEIVRPDEQRRWIHARGFPILDERGEVVRAAGLARDVTHLKQAEFERDRAERKLLENQKLESLGILAAGIAHDFNNLLTSILGNAEIASDRLEEAHPAREGLRQVVRASKRAAYLTRQMLAYTGRGSITRRVIDLSAFSGELGDLLRTMISKRVTLDLDLDPEPLPIEVDTVQLQQILMNLVINGAEACGDFDGRVTIKSLRYETLAEWGGTVVSEHPQNRGPFACLEVSDTGMGIDPTTLTRIFDPFFSTKASGSGLGLAAVLGIVRGHDGSLAVRTQPGYGTSFGVFLPLSNRAVERRSHASIHELPTGGTILVVDDQPILIDIARASLSVAGYETLGAASGRDALEIFSQRAREIDLVLLDVQMTDIDGSEILHGLRSMRRDIPVILTSGYNEVMVSFDIVRSGATGFIAKPFSPRALAVKVGEMLKR